MRILGKGLRLDLTSSNLKSIKYRWMVLISNLHFKGRSILKETNVKRKNLVFMEW
jgi:hypothetical protein